ncbi:MAG: tetratricopeptide repeat protein [Bacteroidota bacterium]
MRIFYHVILMIALGGVYRISPAQTIEILDDRSSAIWASSVSIAYGFSYKQIIQLEDIFKNKGLEPTERRKEIVGIISDFREGMEKEKDKTKMPTTQQLRKWLGDEVPEEVILLLSSGEQNPIFFGGQIQVTYGLNADAFEELLELLYDKELSSDTVEQETIKLSEWEIAFKDLLTRYDQLNRELAFRTDEMAKEAKKSLEEGKFEKAQKILEDRYYFAKERVERAEKEQAFAAFDYAKVLELAPLKYREATIFYSEAVKLAPENSTFINYYALNLMRLGRFDTAVFLFQKAIQLDSIAFGNKSTSVASLYNNLGLAWNSKGNYDLAIEYHNEAMRINTTSLGKNHPKVSEQYNHLGAAWKSKGEFDKSIQYFNKALRIDLSILGKNHPNISYGFSNLGEVYYSIGDYDKAINFCNKALEIDSVIFGVHHPNIAKYYNNLGEAYAGKREYDRAINFCSKALEIDSVIFGVHHPNIAKYYNNLGEAYSGKGGDYERAVNYYYEALEIDSLIFGIHHPNIAKYYNNLGEAYAGKGQYERAINYYYEALKIDSMIFGVHHPNIAKYYNNLGEALNAKTGDFEKTILLQKYAIAIYSAYFSQNHPSIAETHDISGNAYISLRNYSQAIQEYKNAIKILNLYLPPSHPEILVVQKKIDYCQLQIEK